MVPQIHFFKLLSVLLQALRFGHDLWPMNENRIKASDVIENKKKAIALKEKGNDAFKKKKYEVAENFYSEALQLNLDSRPLWTNRAVCRNTMKKYEDALADCLSALSIDPKNTKKGISNCVLFPF